MIPPSMNGTSSPFLGSMSGLFSINPITLLAAPPDDKINKDCKRRREREGRGGEGQENRYLPARVKEETMPERVLNELLIMFQ